MVVGNDCKILAVSQHHRPNSAIGGTTRLEQLSQLNLVRFSSELVMSTTATMELVGAPELGAQDTQSSIVRHVPLNVEVSTLTTNVEVKGTTAIIITTITGVTMISSLLNGLVTIALPAMARDLKISEALLLWSVRTFVDVGQTDIYYPGQLQYIP